MLLAVALAADLAFQGPGVVLVVHPDPEVEGDPGQAEVAVLLARRSAPRPWLANEVLTAGERRIEQGRLSWLGSGSRIVRDGVELHLASGRRIVLRFDGGPPATGGPVAVAPLACPCSYVDKSGVYHLVSTAAEVPPQYLALAHPVSGDAVQVLPTPASRPSGSPPEPEPESVPEEPVKPQSQRRAQSLPPRPPRADYYEYIRRITGQRGPQFPVNCIGNDGKPTSCDWLFDNFYYPRFESRP
jgi:hypothetical protein